MTNWVVKAQALPGGAVDTQQQVQVEMANFNRVTVTLCWQAPGDQALRSHSQVAYIN